MSEETIMQEITTTEREHEIQRLARIAGIFARLERESPTPREAELTAQHPRMPRERVLRIVAAELLGETQ